MKLFIEPAGSRHRLAYLAAAVALIALSMSMIAARANADQIYWANHESVAYSQLNDTSGGYLQRSVFAVHDGEGTAIDTASGRIYVSQANQILWFDLNGAGSGALNTAGAIVDNPTNIVIDPATQTLYWANDTAPGSIGYARVDGAGGGTLAQPGSTDATVNHPTRLAIDTRHERVYWWNAGSDIFSFVTTDGLLGGDLVTPGLTIAEAEGMGGIAIEPYSTPEELYFVNNEAPGIFHVDPLLGGAPEEIQGAFSERRPPENRSNAEEPIGLVFDEAANKFYWANGAIVEEPAWAIGTATLFGRPSTLKVFPIAPIHSPAFASVLKEPELLASPQLSVSGTTLGCTPGEWEGDHPGASVYAAPTTYSYQWRKGSEAIDGALGTSYTATETGSYSCEVVAENAAGPTKARTSSASLTFPTKPKTTTTSTSKPKPNSGTGDAKLASNKPVKVKAGGTAVIKVDLVNSGKTDSGSTKVCGNLTKQAKKGLKTPGCVTVKSVAAGKTVVAQLKVKTLAKAHGTYKFTVAVSGAMQANLTAKVQVSAGKRK